MSALDKVLALSGTQAAPDGEDPNAGLVLALSSALGGLRLYLASSDSDDDGDDDSGGKGGGKDDDGDADDIENSATYKALIKKGVAPKLARAMALKASKKVAASALAESACVILAGLTGADAEPGPEPTYLGRMVALAAPPGGSASDRRLLAAKQAAETVPALMLELAAGKMQGTAAVAHEPYHGVHSHAHVHSGDNMHGPVSDRVHTHGY